MENINQGSINFGDIFFDKKPRVSVFQSGFRHTISPVVSIASHVMYRAQDDLPNHFEANIKGIFMDKIWVGVGHRVDYANNFTFGVVHKQIKLGYTHEIPTNKSYLIPQPTHEFIATFSLWRKYGNGNDGDMVIW
nr:type IX secretion system membrane protein PorP/SprF [Belliella baltica]